MRVYHLLSSEYALSNVALGRIRLSRYSDLNDPFELLAGNMGDKKVRAALRRWREDFERTSGLLCFSKRWAHPVLWSHYASKHRGICLGFDLADHWAVGIEYSKERLPIAITKGGSGKLNDDVVRQLLRVKYSHWKYEKEVRVLKPLSEALIEAGNYFIPFSPQLALREVILGPLCSIPIDGTKSLVDRLYDSVVVRKARLAFKTFTVVLDKRHSRPPKANK